MTPTEHLFSKLGNDDVEDKCQEQKHLGDDQKDWSQFAGDDIQKLSVLNISKITNLGNHLDLMIRLHIFQTILTDVQDVVTNMET